MASLVYMNYVLDALSESRNLQSAARGIARQTGYAAAGAALGGVLGGPFGALVGTFAGGLIGYSQSTSYDSLISAVYKLSDHEKAVLGEKIQQLVGAVSIDEFVRWIQNEGHRQLLLTLLQQAVKNA